ncbi:TetR/AcrR family transcriptional regulator [Nocardiopsis mangrovi]|uniref:TetR/AcrR family transcriptional regulator n=1 Tax=Nocardiopsis mangrovi TaxID=1179818 RepID=A0ABV9DTF3_9ACTN
MNMRSIGDDRNTRAIIRDEALRLFAADGPDAVPVRRIASAAGVSPGLVIHHFGSKNGLRDAVDEHVLHTLEAMLGELAGRPPSGRGPESALPAEALLRHMRPDSPIPLYLRRLLQSHGDAGRRVFRRLFEMSTETLQAMVAAGVAEPGADAPVRAAFLLVNDLSVLLLRDHLTDVLGVDPLSVEGMSRWTSETLAVYDAGLRGGHVQPDGGTAS